MKDNYIIDYVNEAKFKEKERAIKKYHMLAYKKLLFDYYPSLREGKLLGNLVYKNDEYERYELPLPTDEKFAKVYGNIVLHYKIYKDKKEIILETLTPEDILIEGQTTYKGVLVSKSHKELDMFRINLLNSIDRGE